MNKEVDDNKVGQKSDDMNAMDQGLNFIAQVVNNATGLDKGNDGKMEKEEG
ncbi:hypothetical protein WAK64_07515 [Bacillus spongiae]|uniref:Variable outer membrane protein n=1 Tax=Bacillus spongiae TaxID=2683610 RepID=A0ABU8HC50_9BACI